MKSLSIVAVAGSVTRPSRTSALVAAVAASVAERVPAAVQVIELVDAARHLFAALTPDRLSNEARDLVDAVEGADLLVVGTPVYRASYTGALKHLFDLSRRDAFAGKPVVLAATGGSELHGLVIEHQLRPLFGFFNALCVPTGVYATEADFRDYRVVGPSVLDRIERAAAEAAGLLQARSLVPAGIAAHAGRLPAAAAF